MNECEGPSGSFPSAGGSSTYGIAYMSGTSMATPVTTGNAALIVNILWMDIILLEVQIVQMQ